MANKKVLPPGETLKESIRFLNMTEEDFARRLGKSKEYLERFIGGEEPLTEELAASLEALTGSPANFWKMLERKYRRSL